MLAVTGPTRRSRFELRVPAEVRRFGRLRFREAVLLELPLGRSPPQGALIETRRHGPAAEAGQERLRRDDLAAASRRPRRAASRPLASDRPPRRARRRRRQAAPSARAARSRPGSTASAAAIVEGVVLGDEQSLSDGLRQRFRASGLYHLLAVSGQNVVLVAGGRARAGVAARHPALARADRRARGDRGLRARGRRAAVGDPRRGLRARSSRWPGSRRGRPTAGTSACWARSCCSRGTRTRCSTRASSSRSRRWRRSSCSCRGC